jgi:ornithine cyclodeaminase/alanine dehydrogenase-like protein (mu-crystallin family)
MDGGFLTLARTAGVSAVAARVLSRTDAKTLGILGAGPQAEFHIRLLCSVRPIETVVVWSRNRERATALIDGLRLRGVGEVSNWVVGESPDAAVRCDLVVTATAATEPVLEGALLADGAHLTAIGAHTPDTREIDTTAVTRAATIVVETADTLREAGDLQIAEREAGGVLHRVRTLGAVLGSSRAPGAALSLFKSCGVAFEDLAVARLAFERSETMNLGSEFRLA